LARIVYIDVVTEILPLAENPHRAGKPLVGPLAGQHFAHRGGYRVVYRIDDDRVVVVIFVLRPITASAIQ